MDFLILNKNFETIHVLDSYDSVIWTDRYNKCGDFEIYLSLSDSSIFDHIVPGNYLWSKESEHLMFIENYLIETDVEDGSHVTVTGRSLESMLDRRIVWGLTNLTGSFQDGIEKLLNEAIISPSIPERKISNFIFAKSTDKRITDLTIEVQLKGEDLLTVLEKLCGEKKVGFKIILNDKNQFVFSLYVGEDRSYAQEKNTFVVFSPNFENIVNSSYLESDKKLKNVAWITGEGEGSEMITTSVGTSSGLDRREIHCDASDISSTNEDDTKLTNEQYIELLKQRGNEDLSELTYTKTFEGEAGVNRMYVYGRDFFIGDTIQMANEYGKEGQASISEMVFSYNKEGYAVYPTLTQNDGKEIEI